MNEEKSSYYKIISATSIFGGVQIFNIFISILRFKFIAIFLGPIGMGIAGLFTSAINLISGLTSFGLGTSAVKNVASANSDGDSFKISEIITTLRRLVWLTGLFGCILTMTFSKTLSKLTFGNENFTHAFIWLSITLLLMQLSKGQLAILQGLRKIKYLASANLLGSTFGFIFSIPIYYYFGINGIAPAIIITTLTSLFFSWYFSRKIKIIFFPISLKRTYFKGKEMLYLGLMISMSSLITLVASYGVRIFISYNGGVSDVGLYTAGFDIINGYMGIILLAMASDYFPRLASVAKNNKLCKKAINEQAEISIILIAPVIIIFIVFINWIIILLYSEKFLDISSMIQWASLGLIFKVSSWSIAYVLLAKGA
jgi:O-antigen/teichoic acid export membrane protein